jgi:PleD family two-component response regulator
LSGFLHRQLVRSYGALLELTISEADMRPTLLRRDANRHLAVFVGGALDALAHVEPMLTGRAYEVEFVAADDEPYATIAALKPDIIVVNLSLDNESGFQLLTMLRLDPETAQIPVLSYVQEDRSSAYGEAGVDPGPTQLSASNVSRVQRH